MNKVTTTIVSRMSGRLEVWDPGFVRTRRGVRAACTTVLAWLTMVAVTAACEVADPLRITLFAAGAAFEGALLAPDPQPKDRVRQLGWAWVVSVVVLILAVQVSRTAVWAAAALLVLLMFFSYAMRSWSPRLASLALMGAITVYVTGAGYITIGRIGWFVLALAVGFAWIAVWERVVLPDHPVRSLNRSVQAYSRRAADTVDAVLDRLQATGHGTTRDREHLNRSLKRVVSCRNAIENQFPGALTRGVSQHDIEGLRVALYAGQKGLEEMVDVVDHPQWIESLPDQIAWSITNTLHGLSTALRDDADAASRDKVARQAQVLRGYVHGAVSGAIESDEASVPPASLLAALTMLGAGELVAQSSSQATVSAIPGTEPLGAARTIAPPTQKISPTMALAIQAVVAALAAGVIARLLGNDQGLVVAWTAFVVIGGSAGASTRRAWVRIPATILGAVGGVVIAACVPDSVFWTIAVVVVGVFFTVFTAPISYPAMVFWISIALVPLFATEGRYLDLIVDKTIAALIGGCVAAVVALTVLPIRTSREVRPAVLKYLDALDQALASHLPGTQDDSGTTDAELDRAHSSLAAIFDSAATESQIFAQHARLPNEEAVRIDAVHEAYLRLTPLLSASSRRLHGWTDDRVDAGIRYLCDIVAGAKAAVGGGAGAVDELPPRPFIEGADDNSSLELEDSVRRVEDLASRLTELTALHRSVGRLEHA